MSKIKIADFAEVITGGTPSTSNPEYWENGDVPWLQSGACQNDVITGCDTFITQKGLENSAAKMMKPDSVLIALTGATTGKVGYLTFEACANQSVTGIQPNERFISKYLYYYLRGIRQKILDDSYGGAQKHISQGYVKNIEVPLGSIEEQKTITKLLESVDTTIALRQQELQLLDDLIKARFVEMFGNPVRNEKGWQKRSLKDVCSKLNDGTHFSPVSFEKGDYKYVTAKNIKPGGFDFSNITYVPEAVHRPIYERCNPEYGDVLYIKDGVTTGIAMVNTLEEEFTLLSSVALLKQNRNIMNGHFLCGVLNNNEMYSDIRSNMGGAAITRLTIAKLNGIQIIVPPIEFQNQFADFVTQVNKSKAVVQKALDKAQLLFDSLMQQFFG